MIDLLPIVVNDKRLRLVNIYFKKFYEYNFKVTINCVDIDLINMFENAKVKLDDLSLIDQMTNIKSLNLRHTKVIDLGPLANLPLQTLYLSYTKTTKDQKNIFKS